MITVFRRLMNNDMELTEQFENPVLTCAGEVRVISWQNRLIKDDEGNNIGTLSFGEDVTEG